MMKKPKARITTTVASSIFTGIEKSGKTVGGLIERFSNLKLYKNLTDNFGLFWLFERIVSVDIEKVNKQVEKFRKKYPEASIEELCDKLITHKAFYTGTIGFTSGLIPGNIPALLFDFVSTIGAEAELIYEIALIYGMDLADNTRKGEVLTLIALGAGSTKSAEAALKLAVNISSRKVGSVLAEKTLKGLSVIIGKTLAKKTLGKLIPVLGGIIGASLNASMVILAGKGAKAFYKNLNKVNQLYSGKLPEEVKVIYSTKPIEASVNDNIRDLVSAKAVIMILNNFEYSDESILKVVEHNFSELMSDYEIKESLLNEIIKPSFDDSVFLKLDKPTISLIITRSILCITSIEPLKDPHKQYLSKLADQFELPFEVSQTNNLINNS